MPAAGRRGGPPPVARKPARPGTLVFSHANSFPAGTYGLLFEAWRAQGWQVAAVPRFGHDPRYPASNNWPHLRDELLALVDRTALHQRVVLVGHSMGGYLSLLAASRRPQAVAGVVLLDAPVVAGWRAHGIRVFKATGLVKRVTPGQVSQRRRWQWPSAEAAQAHFAAKRVFARWHPEVLADYLQCGLEPDPAGESGAEPTGAVRLAFKREVETRIYNTLPDHIGPLLARYPVHAPVAFLGGTQSVENRQVGLASTRTLCRTRMAWIEGSHLFPMEKPLETADAALGLIAQMPPLPQMLS